MSASKRDNFMAPILERMTVPEVESSMAILIFAGKL